MNERCIGVEEWLEPDEAARQHLETCLACQDLAGDLEAVRGKARSLASDAWADGPPLAVDVEGALAKVLAADLARRRPSRHLRWRGRLVGSTGALAAALLLFSLAAPLFLRLRIETPPTAQAPMGWVAGHHTVFWTSAAVGHE